MTSISSALRDLQLTEAFRDGRARDIANAVAAGDPVDPIRVEMFTEAEEAVREANRKFAALTASKESRP